MYFLFQQHHAADSASLVEFEIGLLREKLRELQLEISKLNREIQRKDEEHNKLSLLMTRR